MMAPHQPSSSSAAAAAAAAIIVNQNPFQHQHHYQQQQKQQRRQHDFESRHNNYYCHYYFITPQFWLLSLLLLIIPTFFVGLWKQCTIVVSSSASLSWNDQPLIVHHQHQPHYHHPSQALSLQQQQQQQQQQQPTNNNNASSSSSSSTISSTQKLTAEIVVTILHDRRQSKKRILNETAEWLLLPPVHDIPVTICSPDALVDRDKVLVEGRRVPHFSPEHEHVFGRLLLQQHDQHHNNNHTHHHNSNRTVTILPIVNGKMASEVPGYLSYILANWESLPDVMIFLHSIPQAHDPNILSNIRHVLDDPVFWTREQIGFLNINDHIMICRPGSGPGGGPWWKYWEILGFDPKYVPRRIKTPCCAQFMVTKERVYLRTKWFYQQALKLAYETEDAVFFEHYFHIIFGEQPILSADRELRTYVRSNWTKIPAISNEKNSSGSSSSSSSSSSIRRDAVLHNPYPNVPCAESMKPWYEKAKANPKSYYPAIRKTRDACPPGNDYWFSFQK